MTLQSLLPRAVSIVKRIPIPRFKRWKSKDDIPGWWLFAFSLFCSLQAWFWWRPVKEVGPDFVDKANALPLSALLNTDFLVIAALLVAIACNAAWWTVQGVVDGKILVDRLIDNVGKQR